MNQNSSLVGPRGWAFVSLSLGVVMAVPFLRGPNTPNTSENLLSTPSTPPWEASAIPYPSNAPAFAEQSTVGKTDDGAVFSSTSSVAWDTRTISGVLPTTDAPPPTDIPDWVAKPSPLDEMIARDEPNASHQESLARANAVSQAAVREFRAWRNATGDRDPAVSPDPSSAATAFPLGYQATRPIVDSNNQSTLAAANANSPFSDSPSPSAIQSRSAAWTESPAALAGVESLNEPATPESYSNVPPISTGVVNATLRRTAEPLPIPTATTIPAQNTRGTTGPATTGSPKFVYQPGLKGN